MCRMLKVLPRAGGLLDQDYYHIQLLQIGLEEISALEKEEADKQAAKNKPARR